ncbi:MULTISPECIES: amidase [Saccharibacillus]|uniref:amidase n=1 Tax=Saccharibacillus TaxID=456492 RepID=UPI0012389762|nr:amidase [Saccharibacillus sp. WB 17]MWJ33035.1 amidase [Saccharibacillus sp. WB 17]
MSEAGKRLEHQAEEAAKPVSTFNRSEKEHYGAFVDRHVELAPTGSGPLDGLTFAVKDVFDIQGVISGAGNPDWLRTHAPSARTAPALEQLLAAGARLQGTTHTDELMYSLNGENAHYGTPVNPAAPDRIPGGSSSGSAVAAAAGRVDFAVGTDTGGSVRIPSAYCGLYGFRPTHGAVSAEGVIALAPSFDTVGWMSRDVSVLRRVGQTLLGDNEARSGEAQPFVRFFAADEAWALPEESDRALLRQKLHAVEDRTGRVSGVPLTAEGESLADWSAAFRVLQGLEIWKRHGAWIERERPAFGPGIAERFAWTSTLHAADAGAEAELRRRVRLGLISLLGEDGLLVVPTAPGPAPRLGLRGPEAEAYRAKTMQLPCIAGLAGLPQVTVPVLRADGLPIGLSWIGGPGTDLRLLDWVAGIFGEEVRP